MKSKIIKSTLFISTLTVCFSACATSYSNVKELNKITYTKDNQCIKADKTKSPWYIGNLYDCKDKSFFIPYQLWSGAKYDGNKTRSINHAVDITTNFQYREDKPSKTRALSIKGALPWINTTNGKGYKVYIRKEYKKRYTKNEYFIFHKDGIGRVYDDKGYQYGLTKKERYFTGSHIKFPAGYGWKLNKEKLVYGHINNFKRTTSIIVKAMEFDDKTKELESITFHWILNDGVENIEYNYNRDVGQIYQYGGK